MVSSADHIARVPILCVRFQEENFTSARDAKNMVVALEKRDFWQAMYLHRI